MDAYEARRQAVERLLAECGEASPRGSVRMPAYVRDGRPKNRCHHCGRGGKLKLHHLTDGTVVHVHRSCHRRMHHSPEHGPCVEPG